MAILSKVQQEYPPGNSAVEDRITVSRVNNLYELQRVSKTDTSSYLPGGQYNLFAFGGIFETGESGTLMYGRTIGFQAQNEILNDFPSADETLDWILNLDTDNATRYIEDQIHVFNVTVRPLHLLFNYP